MHAVIPIHTTGEFHLFKHLLESELYFTASNNAPTAGHTACTVDFEKLTMKWNEMVD